MSQVNFVDGLENKDTLRLEGQFAARIEDRWNVKLQKIPSTYSLDYAIIRNGGVVSWIEVKCRTNSFLTYPTYMIALKKWNAMREFQSTSHLKAFLGVAFVDGDYWLDASQVKEIEVKMGGRTDRGLIKDIEPMVHFSTNYFTKFKFK